MSDPQGRTTTQESWPGQNPGSAVPSAYLAATTGTALIDRSDRIRMRVDGRAPGQMLTGILSGTMPKGFEEVEPGVRAGRAHASTVLTPKGKLVTELRILRLEDEVDGVGAFLLDLPAAGGDGLRDHFKRYLPPRLARVHELSDESGMLTVLGPGAAALLSREAFGLRVDAPVLESMDEGEARIMEDGSPVGIHVVRSGDVHPPAFDVFGDRATLRSLRARLEEGGAELGDATLWQTLRMERGRPEYGVELDYDTLPPEAGLDPRAIDHGKGCYTGQEVIVRIRDRGRVNRRLRGLLLGERPLPEPGTEVWIEGRDRTGGTILSAIRSPRFGQGIALAMVRREAEPPTNVRLGGPDGPEVELRDLTDEGWALTDADLVADHEADG